MTTVQSPSKTSVRSRLHSYFQQRKLFLEHDLLDPADKRSVRPQFDFEESFSGPIDTAAELLLTAGIALDAADVFVYGSRARGSADNLSDWDLVLVNPIASSPLTHRRYRTGVNSFDVSHGSLPALIQQLSQRHGDNNNWLLNACAEGRPLTIPSPGSSVLFRHASILRRKGPEPPNYESLTGLAEELSSRLQAVSSDYSDTDDSARRLFLRRIAYDRLAMRIVYVRYILDRKWTTCHNALLIACEQEYPSLFSALMKYSSAPETREGTECINKETDDMLREIQLRANSERRRK